MKILKENLIKKTLIFSMLVLLFGMVIIPSTIGNLNEENKIVYDNSSLMNIDDGLIGYWSFNEGSGTIAYDDSGNANDGTVTDASWISDSIYDKSLHFDIGNYIHIGDINDYIFTMILWVKPDFTITKDTGGPGGGSSLNILTWNNYYNYNFGFGDCTSLVQDETITVVQGSYGERRTAVQNVDITSNDWHMIVIVWNSGLERYDIYFDGVVQSVTYGSSLGHVPLMNCNYFEINRDDSQYKGLIDEVRIYNRVLSNDEIQELYNNPSGLKSALLFGQVDNLNTGAGNFITFTAVKVKSIRFFPFEFIQYNSGEKIRISEKYTGLILPKFIIGFFKTNI